MGPHPELEVGTAVRLDVIGTARVLPKEGGASLRLRASDGSTLGGETSVMYQQGA